MSFRTRLLSGFLLLALLPLAAFAVGLRREITQRLTAEFDRQADLATASMEADLSSQSRMIERRLIALAARVADDDRLRRAILVGPGSPDRAYQLDFASAVMEPAGLSVLQLQDASGRILSSGHFRNEFDRLAPELPDVLGRLTGGATLTTIRTADTSFVALVRMQTLRVSGQPLVLVGGLRVGDQFLASLAPDEAVTVLLELPGAAAAGSDPAAAGSAEAVTAAAVTDLPANRVVGRIEFPFAGPGGAEEAQAHFVIRQSLAALTALQRSLSLWFAAGSGLALLGAMLLAAWVSARLSRPLEELSKKTSRLDLDRLDIDFRSSRRDEVGDLSRLLQAMTGRLRASASRLRDAERQATRGEMARQVNHDIKNGLVPIRNVVEHLTQVTQDEPEQLGRVFADRGTTLISGIRYLEDLAANYARLAPKAEPQRIDVNRNIGEIAAAGNLAVRCEVIMEPDLPALHGDPVAFRRILENLISNAREAVGEGGGPVRVRAERVRQDGSDQIRISVEDDGPGLQPEDRDKIFADFFTTRPGGTGLGLSIVRRLVTDMGGRISVHSEPGQGARFTVELPAAEHSAGERVDRSPEPAK